MKVIQWKDTEKKRDDFDELIPCLEKMFLLKYPEDYKQCVIENGGGTPEPCRFDVNNEKGITVERLFSLDPRSEYFFWYYNGHIKFCQADNYPIAEDSKKNFICLDYREGFSPKISFFNRDLDHLKRSTDRDCKPSITNICNSFTEFLDMLY